MAVNEAQKKRAATRRCPVCGHESWRIIYGMVMPDVRDEYPKAEFAGCVIVDEERIYAASGKVERGVATWACQSLECRHRWW
jgi:hypothetical protein